METAVVQPTRGRRAARGRPASVRGHELGDLVVWQPDRHSLARPAASTRTVPAGPRMSSAVPGAGAMLISQRVAEGTLAWAVSRPSMSSRSGRPGGAARDVGVLVASVSSSTTPASVRNTSRTPDGLGLGHGQLLVGDLRPARAGSGAL